MTSLLTILSIVGLVAICWMMAKYNKSDNLFWILLISLFAGMAGGALVGKLTKAENEKKIDFTQVYNPTQVSPAICVDFCTLPDDTRAYKAEPAGKVTEIPVCDSKVDFVAPSKTFGEIRGQPTPFIPFDTS
jgi:hypothetical protein